MTRLISYGGKWKNVHSPKITDCSSHKTSKPTTPSYNYYDGEYLALCVKCGFSIFIYEERCSERMPSGKGAQWHVSCCDHCRQKQ